MLIGCTPTILRTLLVGFVPVTIEKSGIQQGLIAVPAGCTKALIEAIGCGGDAASGSSGSGGGYSKTNSVSLVDINNIWYEIKSGQYTYVRLNSASGQIICSANSGNSGGQPNNVGVGDIKYNGGAGNSGNSGATGGGGAGRTGGGGSGNISGTTGGSGNFPGGNGGTNGGTAQQLGGRTFGGGGASQFAFSDDDGNNSYNTGSGAPGWISVTFS